MFAASFAEPQRGTKTRFAKKLSKIIGRNFQFGARLMQIKLTKLYDDAARQTKHRKNGLVFFKCVFICVMLSGAFESECE